MPVLPISENFDDRLCKTVFLQADSHSYSACVVASLSSPSVLLAAFLRFVSFPSCWCVVPHCSRSPSFHVVSESRVVATIFHRTSYVPIQVGMLASPGLTALQCDIHVVYVSLMLVRVFRRWRTTSRKIRSKVVLFVAAWRPRERSLADHLPACHRMIDPIDKDRRPGEAALQRPYRKLLRMENGAWVHNDEFRNQCRPSSSLPETLRGLRHVQQS